MEGYGVGMMARSLAGHDKGKVYMVLDVKEPFVYLVEGKIRKLDHPKKKRIKHVQVEVSNIGVSLVENDKVISKRDYASNGKWDEATGDLLTGLKEEKIVPGKQYDEALKVTNSGSIDSYVRVIIKKSWTDKEGVKDTTLSPDLIDLNLNLKEGSGWVIDKNASTKERTILYYTGILPAGKSTPALSNTLTIDKSIATKVTQDVKEEDGYKTITTTYAYDGYNFQLEAEADAVQTHNAQDAIKSAWGVDVDVDGNGNISLR